MLVEDRASVEAVLDERDPSRLRIDIRVHPIGGGSFGSDAARSRSGLRRETIEAERAPTAQGLSSIATPGSPRGSQDPRGQRRRSAAGGRPSERASPRPQAPHKRRNRRRAGEIQRAIRDGFRDALREAQLERLALGSSPKPKRRGWFADSPMNHVPATGRSPAAPC